MPLRKSKKITYKLEDKWQSTGYQEYTECLLRKDKYNIKIEDLNRRETYGQ